MLAVIFKYLIYFFFGVLALASIMMVAVCVAADEYHGKFPWEVEKEKDDQQ